MRNRIRGIIYDCDGVLFESRQANLAYYNAVLADLGEPLVAQDQADRAHLCHTAASPDVFAGLLGAQHVAQAMALAEQLDVRRFIPWMNPEPGMLEALRALSACYPLAVATNRGASIGPILEHFALGAYFQTVVTSRDVERPKPFPDMLLEAARRLELPPEQLLFVGDSPLDQRAAQSAGIVFANYRGELESAIRIDHHQQLVEFLISET